MTSTSYVEELDSGSNSVAPLECEETLLLVMFDGTVRMLSMEDGCELWGVASSSALEQDGPAPQASYEETLGDTNQRKGAFRLFRYLVPGLGAASKEVFMFDGRYLQRVEGLFHTGAPKFGTLHSTNRMQCDYLEVDSLTGKVMASSVREASERARRRLGQGGSKARIEGSHMIIGAREGDVSRTLIITREAKINEGFEQSTGNSWTIRVNLVDVANMGGGRPETTPPSATRGEGSNVEGAMVLANTSGGGSVGPVSSLNETVGSSDMASRLRHLISVCVSGCVRFRDPSTHEVLWEIDMGCPITQAHFVSTPRRVNLAQPSCRSRSSYDITQYVDGSVRSDDTDTPIGSVSPCPSSIAADNDSFQTVTAAPILGRWVSRRQAHAATILILAIPVGCERLSVLPHSPVSPASCNSSGSGRLLFPTPVDAGTSGSLVPSSGSPPSMRAPGGYFDPKRRFLFVPPVVTDPDGFPRTDSEMLADCYEVVGYDAESGLPLTATPCSPVNSTPTQRGFLNRSVLGKKPTFLSNARTVTFPSKPVHTVATPIQTSPQGTPPNILRIADVPASTAATKDSASQAEVSLPTPASVPRVLPDRLEFTIPSFLRQTYQLVGRLGRGGYGVVFLIKPYHANLSFALKAVFFSPGQIRTDEARRRILNEVEIAATLRSEHFLRPGNTWIEPATPQLIGWLATASDLCGAPGCEGFATNSFPAVDTLTTSVVSTNASKALHSRTESDVNTVSNSSAAHKQFFGGFSTSTEGSRTSSSSTSIDEDSASEPASIRSTSAVAPSPPGSARGPTPSPGVKESTHTDPNDRALVVRRQPHAPGPFSLSSPVGDSHNLNSTWSVVNSSPARTPYILFLQMEYCPLTLTQWLHERHQEVSLLGSPLTPTQILNQPQYHRTALSLAVQLFKALAVLQSRSLLHRDIKPSNLFLVPSANSDDARLQYADEACLEEGHHHDDSQGEREVGDETYTLKVGDFGLATCVAYTGLPSAFEGLDPTVRSSVEDLSSFPSDVTNTKTGHNSPLAGETRSLTAGIGSPLYAAPEQWLGSQYGTKVDVFSAGLVLLEIFCLFDTASERIHVFNDVRRRGGAGIPQELVLRHPHLAAAIERCVEPLPAQRGDASSVLKLLRAVQKANSCATP